MNILHGLTGSVATTIAHKFGESYRKKGFKSKVVTTFYSKRFDAPKWAFDANFDDSDEWFEYGNNSTVLHIDLTKWADVFVIAPCSANTLAKVANGLCDNLLTCCARAWDFDKQFVIAPSMNTKMWNHPITQKHLNEIKSWGVTIVPPIEKKLFCGDFGMGAMADTYSIVQTIKAAS